MYGSRTNKLDFALYDGVLLLRTASGYPVGGVALRGEVQRMLERPEMWSADARAGALEMIHTGRKNICVMQFMLFAQERRALTEA